MYPGKNRFLGAVLQGSRGGHSTQDFTTESSIYSTLEYNTVQSCTVQYIQYSTVQYSTLHYITLQYSTVQYSEVPYSTVHYSTLCLVQYSTLHAAVGGSKGSAAVPSNRFPPAPPSLPVSASH